MDLAWESALSLVGFGVGAATGALAYVGYKTTASPTLFRLCIAFSAIGTGFLIIWVGNVMTDVDSGHARWIQTLGNGVQMTGYFFITFSYGIKSFFPKTRSLRSIILFPPVLFSYVHLEHVFKSISFVLLIYGAIETLLSFTENKNRGAVFVACGFAFLALGEFLSWYSLVFPESVLYNVSIVAKIAGLVSMFIPVTRIQISRMRAGDPDA